MLGSKDRPLRRTIQPEMETFLPKFLKKLGRYLRTLRPVGGVLLRYAPSPPPSRLRPGSRSSSPHFPDAFPSSWLCDRLCFHSVNPSAKKSSGQANCPPSASHPSVRWIQREKSLRIPTMSLSEHSSHQRRD